MTEELTTRLAKLNTWRVIARTSVTAYRQTQKRIPTSRGNSQWMRLSKGQSFVRET